MDLDWRLETWRKLQARGGPNRVSPSLLRELGIYGGAQGIWVNKARTAPLSDDGTGVTVSVLHTGSSYPDDLAENCVLYRYPTTNRPRGRDAGEIAATKNAKLLQLPVFVITYPTPGSQYRDVRLGWVESWDDALGQFLVTYGEQPPPPLEQPSEDAPFRLVEERRGARHDAISRPGQPRFKFMVLQRYGPRCAFCDLDVANLLEAAHLCPKKENGSDDPRNGLVLCILHHRALDLGLVAIDPRTLSIHVRTSGPSYNTLRLTRDSILHLQKRPHEKALGWLWEKWTASG